MASGDVVNGLSASGATLIFRPAVGVQVCVTQWNDMNASTSPSSLYNGATQSLGFNQTIANKTNGKVAFFIDNTNYLFLDLLGGSIRAFTGIQL